MGTRNRLSAEFVREMLDYDPIAGILTWRPRASAPPNWNSRCGGKIAGFINEQGYRIVRLCGRSHAAHRLIWLMMTGDYPPEHIDHRNCVRDDNRFENLRCASHAENMQNTGAKSTSSSGLKGINKHAQCNRWIARVHHRGKRIYLGLFDSAEAAFAAYTAKAAALQGEFFNAGHPA